MARRTRIVGIIAAVGLALSSPIRADRKAYTRAGKALDAARGSGRPLVLHFVQLSHRRGPTLAKAFYSKRAADKKAEECVVAVLSLRHNRSLAKKYGAENFISMAVALNPWDGEELGRKVLVERFTYWIAGGEGENVHSSEFFAFIDEGIETYCQIMTESYLPALKRAKDEDFAKPDDQLVGAVRFVGYKQLADYVDPLRRIVASERGSLSLKIAATESLAQIDDPKVCRVLAALLGGPMKIATVAKDALIDKGDASIDPCFDALARTDSKMECTRLVGILTKLVKQRSKHRADKWLMAPAETRKEWIAEWRAHLPEKPPADAPKPAEARAKDQDTEKD